MKLYDLELLGNCYKVCLFVVLVKILLEIVVVDFLDGEYKCLLLFNFNFWGEFFVF